jgi:hypothetical protein
MTVLAAKPTHPLAQFDPRKVAYYEVENYISYYRKDWLRLLRASVGLVQEAYHLNRLQAIQGAYWVARAEIAFAPFPNNHISQAMDYMTRFFHLIRSVHNLDIDPGEAARRDVNWWIVHRRLFANPDNGPLVDALTDAYAIAYQANPTKLREAARLRAGGMLLSDQWVNSGKDPLSPLLAQEENALYEGYRELKAALEI